MKRNIKLKGQLRNYMYWPLILTILLVILNVPIYMINTKSGAVVSCFTVIYFVIVCISYNYNKPVLVNELISFATQYGTVQKRLLDEFEIPYALLDHNGKVLWFNQSFSGNPSTEFYRQSQKKLSRKKKMNRTYMWRWRESSTEYS